MSFDRDALIIACEKYGTVSRIVVASARGSTPREVGASMLVWKGGASGTIGGGSLEHEAMKRARAQTDVSAMTFTKHALGPDLGQCCGGFVELLTETYDLQSAQSLSEDAIIRGTGDMPLAAARLKTKARNAGILPEPQKIGTWMIEPVAKPTRHIWIWGAGHVGRALVGVLAPIPEMQITWVDTDLNRFPHFEVTGVSLFPVAEPARAVTRAPKDAEHLIVTYSHALDLELCNQLLLHGFAFAGLIGSATKWARFQKRLVALGHTPESVARITCPIGRPQMGKHPQHIALGVATDLLSNTAVTQASESYA